MSINLSVNHITSGFCVSFVIVVYRTSPIAQETGRTGSVTDPFEPTQVHSVIYVHVCINLWQDVVTQDVADNQ